MPGTEPLYAVNSLNSKYISITNRFKGSMKPQFAIPYQTGAKPPKSSGNSVKLPTSTSSDTQKPPNTK